MTQTKIRKEQLEDSIVGTTDTQNLTNKTIGDALSIDGAITQTGTAKHITITPGASKLVKTAVLRQDITTDAYKNDTVTLTGWSFVTGTAGLREIKSIGYGITFSEIPIITISILGLKRYSDPTALSDFIEIAITIGDIVIMPSAYSISTTGFVCQCINSEGLATTSRIGFSWTATGRLA